MSWRLKKWSWKGKSPIRCRGRSRRQAQTFGLRPPMETNILPVRWEMPIDNSRRLTDQEIQQLLRDYAATRQQEIRDRIVMQYTNLVESVARRFVGAAEPIEDLTQ